MVYLLNFLAIPIYFFIIKVAFDNTKTQKRLFALISTIHIVLFRALSYPYDFEDTEGYGKAFLKMSDYTFEEVAFSFHEYTHWGQGYCILNWIVSCFFNNELLFFVIIGMIISGISVWFYKKMSYSLFLTIIFYLLYPTLYLMGFAVIRQHIAAVLILIALFYIDNKKISLSFSLAAPLFHVSAIVFLPFFIFRKFDLLRCNFFKLFSFLLIGVVLFRLTINIIVNRIGSLLLTDKYEEFGGQAENSNLVPIIILGSLTFVLLTRVDFSKCNFRDKEIIYYILYGFLISMVCFGISGAGRLTLFFLYIVPVAITYLNHYSPKVRSINNIYIMMLLALTLRQLYYSYHSWVLDFDYKFFWNYI